MNDNDDELKAENELLKLKLELEHGMEGQETNGLSPQVENQWLNHIYNFEQHYKNSKRIKVYDFIGRPEFVPVDKLEPNKVEEALNQLQTFMFEKGISLDCICEYEPSVIYRFITEELFDCETDDMLVEGMTRCFTYEEFHPNHDHDIHDHVTDFIEALLTKTWDQSFHGIVLAKTVMFNGTSYNEEGITAIISAFQNFHRSFSLEEFKISKVDFELVASEANDWDGMGAVEALVTYTATTNDSTASRFHGVCAFEMVLRYSYWCIAGFKLPGFGDGSPTSRRLTLSNRLDA